MTTQQVFATDEDVAIRSSSDFALIVPSDQVLAQGDDATFDPTDPWLLRTTGGGLDQRGVGRGCVVLIQYRPEEGFGLPDESFAVESVQANTIKLRRKGQAVDVGEPPRRASSDQSVRFSIRTLGPQLAAMSGELAARLDWDSVQDLPEATQELMSVVARRAAVLGVLYRQCLNLSRKTENEEDAFGAKARAFKSELDELLETSFSRQGAGDGLLPGAAVFRATRLSR